MKNLFINKIKFNIETFDGAIYGILNPMDKNKHYLEFKKGINVLYGPNSIGKSSLLMGIIYSLGGENIFGATARYQSPFKPEFNESIDNKKIKSSYCLLEISNGEKIITIKRDIIGLNTNKCNIQEVSLENFNIQDQSNLFIVNDIGVLEEGGFGKYLFDFLHLKIVEVPTYNEESKSPLYIENLLPLFFVEQRRGWSQIQETQITRYGIKDVKKIAFEYILNLDRFENHVIEIEKRIHSQKLKEFKFKLDIKENEILLDSSSDREGDILLVNKEGYEKMPIDELINELKNKYDESTKALDYLNNQKEEGGEIKSKLRDELLDASSMKRIQFNKVKDLEEEIEIYKSNLKRIEITKRKNEELKEINETMSFPNLSYCPLCNEHLIEKEKGSCLLCGSEEQRISTPDENLLFLEDEKKSFELVLVEKNIKLKKERIKLNECKEKEFRIKKEINHNIKTYSGEHIELLRKYSLESTELLRDIQKFESYRDIWNSLEELRTNIQDKEQIIQDFQKQIKDFEASQNDKEKIDKFLYFLKANIRKLNFLSKKTYLIDGISLDDKYNYSPYVYNYDIYNGTSSSDNIRIMLSYYLAFLQTSLFFKEKFPLNFPNILLLDEPKQQNMNEDTIGELLKEANSLLDKNWQIILTTYKGKEHLENYNLLELEDSTHEKLIKRIN